MFNKAISMKIIAFFMLVPAILILIGVVLATIYLSSFGFGSGVSFIYLVPFLLLMLFFFIISIIFINIAIRYFKNRPFEENKTLGLVLIVFSMAYFVYSVLSFLISNLNGNAGGYASIIIAFLFLLILLPLGLGLKNGYK